MLLPASHTESPTCRRVLRCCCLCCCKHKPTGDPERVLGGRAMLAHKALLLLLCAGVAGCCGYGMARTDPQWVDQALGVLTSLKARAQAGRGCETYLGP